MFYGRRLLQKNTPAPPVVSNRLLEDPPPPLKRRRRLWMTPKYVFKYFISFKIIEVVTPKLLQPCFVIRKQKDFLVILNMVQKYVCKNCQDSGNCYIFFTVILKDYMDAPKLNTLLALCASKNSNEFFQQLSFLLASELRHLLTSF